MSCAACEEEKASLNVIERLSTSLASLYGKLPRFRKVSKQEKRTNIANRSTNQQDRLSHHIGTYGLLYGAYQINK